jgi:competence protein ComGC
MNNVDYNRLLELKRQIDSKQADSNQKREYIELLYRNGSITEQQYQSYNRNQNADEIINAALTIGGVLLATWLISKLFEK